jgi:hypothetical protein
LAVIAVIAVVLSLIALGLSAWTAFRPAQSPAESVYDTGQQTDAKKAICAATDVVRRGVSLNTNLQSPGGGGDVTGSLAVAANARLALSDGGLYLIARLDPAVPKELADAVKAFANTLLDIGAAATAGLPNTDPDQAARLRTADTQNATVADLCK